MSDEKKSLRDLIHGMTPGEALPIIDDYIESHPEDDEAYTLRGMKYWSLGDRSAAINDYLAAIRINPQSKAKMLMTSTYDILDFYNKDLFNP